VRVELDLAAQTPYDGRHSFASLLLHEGQHLAYVAQQIGDSVETIRRVYVHVIEKPPRAAQPARGRDDRGRKNARQEGVRKVCASLLRQKAVNQ
jgi:integrase